MRLCVAAPLASTRWWSRCGLMLLIMLAAPFCFAQAHPPITQAAEVRALTREQAAEARPAKVRGVVNWRGSSRSSNILFADESAGLQLRQKVDGPEMTRVLKHGNPSSWTSLVPGDVVEVDGVTSIGGYAPAIVVSELRVVGRGELSAPRQVSVAHLQSGGGDAQRVQLERVVVQCVVDHLAAFHSRILRACSASGDYILIAVEPAPWNAPEQVVDAEVVATGTVLSLTNSRRELTGLRLGVAREEDFLRVKPPPSDPFATPRAEIGGLRLFRPEGVSPHRRVVEGTVTLIETDGLVIQDRDHGVVVQRTPTGGLRVGDRVQIAAFVEARQPVAYLTDGLVRKLATGAPPMPVPTSPEAILAQSRDIGWRGWGKLIEDFDHRLVRFEGTLMGSPVPGSPSFSVHTASGTSLTVTFARGSRGLVTPPATGSLLSLTGVAQVRNPPGKVMPEFIQPTGVDIMLRGPEDITVLAAPPWWTPSRLGLALAAAALVISLAVVWVLQLRRTVRRQALRIEETLRAHRNAELEHEAATRERLRLAGDLHDGVHQLLTATAYRLESVEDKTPRDPTAALAELSLAQKTLGRSQHELRSLMWGIHELSTAPAEFTALLDQALANMDHWPAGAVVVHRSATAQPLPARAAGSLLMLSQEAVENALRHGRATRVEFTVADSPENLRLTITDNGCGFDPAAVQSTPQGGLGLGHMRRRVADLSGTVTLTSIPGAGTTLVIELPWKHLLRLAPAPIPPSSPPA